MITGRGGDGHDGVDVRGGDAGDGDVTTEGAGTGGSMFQVNEILSCGVDFFNLDKEAKIRWAEDVHIHGYVSSDSER